MKAYIVRCRINESNAKPALCQYADALEDASTHKGVTHERIIFDIISFKERGIKHTIETGLIHPFINTIRSRKDADIYHVTYEMLSPFLLFAKGKKIVTFHHVVNEDEVNGKLWYTLWRISARISARFADHFIAVSSNTKNEMMEKYGIPPEKISVVPTQFSNDFKVLGIKKERFLASIGALSYRKNHQAAIRVFSELKKRPGNEDLSLIILGKGNLFEELKGLAGELGVSDKVEFKSGLSFEELVELYNRCSVILNTSKKEGVGLVTLEAQACGTPVVFFRDSDIPSEIMEAAVSCEDETEMVNRISELLDNPEYMEQIIRTGLDFVNGMRNSSEGIIEVYKRELEK